MKQKILTLQQIYREGASILQEAQVPDAALDAWLLLSHVTGVDKAYYYGRPEEPVGEDKAKLYFAMIEKRRQRIPLQHITGEQEFMGYSFAVNEHVLIPRQDTEILVEEALRMIGHGMRILDLCTGSGCILISVLKAAKERNKIEGLTGTGMDISEKALETAEKNARRLGVDAEFVQSDLFARAEGVYDMILSNPPYIPTKVIEDLQEEVRLHDPVLALDGKEDGLYFYREIIRESKAYLKKGGCLIVEIGHDQGSAVRTLMKEAGYENVCVKKDLSGLDRVVVGM